MRYRVRTLSIVAGAAVTLYVGSFLFFWATPHRFSLAHYDDPQHYVVIFSKNTAAHCFMRAAYWPLICTVPGKRSYPNREEHGRLMTATPYGT